MLADTISKEEYLGLQFNFPKSTLIRTQDVEWIGMCWHTAGATFMLSLTNVMKTSRKLFWTVVACIMSHHQWESLLGTLNYAEVVPLGRLRHLFYQGGEHYFSHLD